MNIVLLHFHTLLLVSAEHRYSSKSCIGTDNSAQWVAIPRCKRPQGVSGRACNASLRSAQCHMMQVSQSHHSIGILLVSSCFSTALVTFEPSIRVRKHGSCTALQYRPVGNEHNGMRGAQCGGWGARHHFPELLSHLIEAACLWSCTKTNSWPPALPAVPAAAVLFLLCTAAFRRHGPSPPRPE